MRVRVIGMTPVPIGLLLLGRDVAEVAIGVVVILVGPLVVVDDFAVIPAMVIVVLHVVDAIAVITSRNQKRCEQRSRTNRFHFSSFPEMYSSQRPEVTGHG